MNYNSLWPVPMAGVNHVPQKQCCKAPIHKVLLVLSDKARLLDRLRGKEAFKMNKVEFCWIGE